MNTPQSVKKQLEPPTGTSPVAAGGGWGGLAPPPPMGGVGGAATGAVAARVAVLNAATGAVVNRTFPLCVRTKEVETDDAETQTDNGTTEVAIQTDHMVFPFVFPGGGWTL